MRVVADEVAVSKVKNHLDELAVLSRIDVESEVFVSQHPQHVIRKQSAKAAVVFLGFEMPDDGREAKFYQQMEYISDGLSRTLFVNSTGNMKLES